MTPEALTGLPSDKRLIVVAGPPRSGSTAIFNIVRLLLEHEKEALTSGWICDLAGALETTVLVKLHRWDPDLAQRANIVLTCHRDLREVARSLARIGWCKAGPEMFDKISDVVRRHTQWKSKAALDISYEEIIGSLDAVVVAIAAVLGIDEPGANIDVIARYVREMSPPVTLPENQTHDLRTLLHIDHRGDEETKPLPIEDDIHQRFLNWQCAYGYK